MSAKITSLLTLKTPLKCTKNFNQLKLYLKMLKHQVEQEVNIGNNGCFCLDTHTQQVTKGTHSCSYS